jgi:hypothetical protein
MDATGIAIARTTAAENKKSWEQCITEMLQKFRDLKPANPDWTVPFVPWCGESYWAAKTEDFVCRESVGVTNDKQDAEKWQIRRIGTAAGPGRRVSSARKEGRQGLTQVVGPAAIHENSPLDITWLQLEKRLAQRS